ncbi:FMN-binding protein [Anoxybacterium hadale]|uniref:FMN-binding protein n=1 Tax=Anoxybacterium hadale TaxID=3408580 RepID=A0ACD1ADE4_9FIRM|nr:FMN-binding protein [Clostridiales bacterium]
MSETHDTHAAHVEKEYSILQIAMNLTIACLVSGIILATTYFITHPIAVEKAKMLEEQAMKDLVAEADSFNAVEGQEGWFAAEKAGSIIAYIVPSESKGYGGTIKIMVAVSTDGKVIDYNILSMNETPGLGDSAAKDFFRDRIKGKTSDDLIVVKDPSNKENVQALTGATITSRAVTEGVRAAVDEVIEFTGGK